jgi:hypothetical protein
LVKRKAQFFFRDFSNETIPSSVVDVEKLPMEPKNGTRN